MERDVRRILERRRFWCQVASTRAVAEWMYQMYPTVFWNCANLPGEMSGGPHPGTYWVQRHVIRAIETQRARWANAKAIMYRQGAVRKYA